MTLTALRGRLYLFGGSGTSAKCFQDLQILDRHEMAWLDVVPEEEKSGSSSNNNSSPKNTTTTTISSSNHNEGGTVGPIVSDNLLHDNRYRFGGSRMYRSDNSGFLFDVDTSTTRHHHSGSLIDICSSNSVNNNCISSTDIGRNTNSNNTDLWRGVGHDNIDSIRRSHHQQMLYTSPNPNEDTVPSVLVRGHGPGRRAGHTATAVNRKIYIFGGSCGSDYLNDFFVLDTDPPPSAVVTEDNPLLLMERRLRHFFNDPEFADVVFVVGDHHDKVYGHKMVLSIVSDCFRAMFTTGFKEADAMEINIPDCTHAAFLGVMEYIYTGTLPCILRQYHINNNTQTSTRSQHHDNRLNNNRNIVNAQSLPLVVEILELADRFFLDHLKQVCERILETAVNSETVEFLLSVAQKSNSIQLLSICQHYYRNNRLPPPPLSTTTILSSTTSLPSASSSNYSSTVHHLNQMHYSNDTLHNGNPNDDILLSGSSSNNVNNDSQRIGNSEHIDTTTSEIG
jgi:BTB/POZ domain/Kelch motif